MTAPRETPPAEDGISGTVDHDGGHHGPNVGPVSGNRTPMVITLVLLALLVVGTVGVTVASLVQR